MTDSTDTAIVTLRGLRKSYGDVKAVQGVDLDLISGERFGLIGPDGAGKTSLLRILCGLLLPSNGQVQVLGFDPSVQAAKIKDGLGYMPQRFSLYPDLSVGENLRFFADIYRVPKAERQRLTQRLLEFSRLGPFVQRRAGALSGGMKQKLALSCTLIHTPKLLILDEPTTGVDPVSRGEFWDLLDELRRQGVTVLVTTPYMDEAQHCDRVALMYQGRILTQGRPQDITSTFPQRVLHVYTPAPQQMAEKLRELGTFPNVNLFGDRIHVLCQEVERARHQMVEWLVSTHLPYTAIEAADPDLEDVFVYHVTQKT